MKQKDCLIFQVDLETRLLSQYLFMDRVLSAIPCFRYLSWRDTKTAVILINRNADFTVVLAKIAETGPKHPNFKRDLGKSDESTFRCVFVQPNDTNREIPLTVMAFDIPTAPRG